MCVCVCVCGGRLVEASSPDPETVKPVQVCRYAGNYTVYNYTELYNAMFVVMAGSSCLMYVQPHPASPKL